MLNFVGGGRGSKKKVVDETAGRWAGFMVDREATQFGGSGGGNQSAEDSPLEATPVNVVGP